MGSRLLFSLPAKVFADPVDGVTAAVEARRWALPLVVVTLFVSLSGAAGALRHDPTSQVVAAMAQAGQLARASENEIQEKIQQAGRVRLAGGIAAGALQPGFVLLVTLVLMLSAWLFDSKAPFGKCFTAAAVAMMPVALYHLLFAVTAFRQLGLTEAEARTLVPSSLLALRPDASPKLARFFSAVDFFSLWSALLLGLGFSAASGLSKPRGVAVGLTLYAIYAALLIGLPGLSGGQS